ncbi:unnamed protein product [Adineta ricciae]|uniref:Uncharacterized protein n=1 Tax=Adineta ricciae TaxID=249248 RepID=A0A815YPF3_ADIRI|nr:unnamed protein product [Adineta ricciae]
MDIILTAVGEFVWSASCAIINFCVSSGFSATAVFISFLCVILTSAFYKYSTSRDQMSMVDNSSCPFNEHDDVTLDQLTSTPSALNCPFLTEHNGNHTNNNINSLSEIEIHVEESTTETETNDEQTSDEILLDTIEGSEEEIQKQQIANIYRLLNDQHLINNWTTTDFLDQLKMYGLDAYEEDELAPS